MPEPEAGIVRGGRPGASVAVAVGIVVAACKLETVLVVHLCLGKWSITMRNVRACLLSDIFVIPRPRRHFDLGRWHSRRLWSDIFAYPARR